MIRSHRFLAGYVLLVANLTRCSSDDVTSPPTVGAGGAFLEGGAQSDSTTDVKEAGLSGTAGDASGGFAGIGQGGGQAGISAGGAAGAGGAATLCGNGVVDVGEQCDDAPANGAAYSCCSAQCAFNQGTVCRSSTQDCDPAETCSGSSALCPADTNTCTGLSGVHWGFNWWPLKSPGDGFHCDVLQAKNWTSETKRNLGVELDQMASLGTKVLRLMIWPGHSGWLIQGGAHSFDPSTYVDANLPELLDSVRARGLQVILALGNYYQTTCTDGTMDDCTPKFWQTAYSDYSAYLADATQWASRIILATKSHPAVLYYDLQNEIRATEQNSVQYVRNALKTFGAPEDKIGFSILQPGDASVLKEAADAENKTLRFVDFHVYYPDLNADVQGTKDSILATLGSRLAGPVIVGEFGMQAATPAEEDAQRDFMTTAMNKIAAAKIPIGLSWVFFDGFYHIAEAHWGQAYAPDEPKHILGWWASNIGRAANADLEQSDATGACGPTPTGWQANSEGVPDYCLVRGGPNTTDAATGSYYARVSQESQTSGSLWLSSNMFPVSPGSTLYVNAYVRGSGINAARLTVTEYDSANQMIRSSATPPFDPVEWHFYDLLYAIRQDTGGSMNFPISPTSARAIVTISATVIANPSYLDVDAVSAYFK